MDDDPDAKLKAKSNARGTSEPSSEIRFFNEAPPPILILIPFAITLFIICSGICGRRRGPPKNDE